MISEDKSVPCGNWQATQLQAVVFLRKAISGMDIFSAITGKAPDRQEDRLKEGLRIQSGEFLGGSFQVVLNPIRVDVVLSPVGVEEGIMVGAGEPLGEFATKLEDFASVIRKWLPDCKLPALRLALVAKALAPADSTVAAYEILKKNLTSVSVDPETMRDMMFRVNWRAASACMPEGYLNRLTTWSAILNRRQIAQFGSTATHVEERYYAYREIDVNTPMEHSEELPADQLAPIFDELFNLVVSSAKSGETRS